ncbi:hypothetical protein, partial [Aeromonas caviae]|uniref:hypothetical protein n=1 Tax=Aeromonas caviae TaxID=648 RepID=UPI001FB88B5E
DFRRVVKNRKIQPEAAFCPTKNQGLEWMNSNPRMQIAKKKSDNLDAIRFVNFDKYCRLEKGRVKLPAGLAWVKFRQSQPV